MRLAEPSTDDCLGCIRIDFRFANDGRFDDDNDENGINNSSKYFFACSKLSKAAIIPERRNNCPSSSSTNPMSSLKLFTGIECS